MGLFTDLCDVFLAELMESARKAVFESIYSMHSIYVVVYSTYKVQWSTYVAEGGRGCRASPTLKSDPGE